MERDNEQLQKDLIEQTILKKESDKEFVKYRDKSE
jgi:hypothetical protein